jgi:hypothetical protein
LTQVAFVLLTAVPADAAQLEVTVRKGAAFLWIAPKACTVDKKDWQVLKVPATKVTTAPAKPHRQLQMMEQLEMLVQLVVGAQRVSARRQSVLKELTMGRLKRTNGPNASTALPACIVKKLGCHRQQPTVLKDTIAAVDPSLVGKTRAWPASNALQKLLLCCLATMGSIRMKIRQQRVTPANKVIIAISMRMPGLLCRSRAQQGTCALKGQPLTLTRHVQLAHTVQKALLKQIHLA